MPVGSSATIGQFKPPAPCRDGERAGILRAPADPRRLRRLPPAQPPTAPSWPRRRESHPTHFLVDVCPARAKPDFKVRGTAHFTRHKVRTDHEPATQATGVLAAFAPAGMLRVDRNQESEMADADWVRVAGVADVAEGQVLGVRVGGREIALYHLKGGDIRATDNICTHEYAKLYRRLAGGRLHRVPAARRALRCAHRQGPVRAGRDQPGGFRGAGGGR